MKNMGWERFIFSLIDYMIICYPTPKNTAGSRGGRGGNCSPMFLFSSITKHLRTNSGSQVQHSLHCEIARHTSGARSDVMSANIAISGRLGRHFYFSCFFKISFKHSHMYCVHTESSSEKGWCSVEAAKSWSFCEMPWKIKRADFELFIKKPDCSPKL